MITTSTDDEPDGFYDPEELHGHDHPRILITLWRCWLWLTGRWR